MFNFDQANEKIPRSVVICRDTKNHHDICHQCSKDGPDFLFGKLRVRGSIDEPRFLAEIKLL